MSHSVAVGGFLGLSERGLFAVVRECSNGQDPSTNEDVGLVSPAFVASGDILCEGWPRIWIV